MSSDTATRQIAARVNADRYVAGLSVRQLAETAGISRSALTERLKGRVDFSAGELLRLGLALNVPAEKWLTDLRAEAAA